jgi:PEP-CTERM motif
MAVANLSASPVTSTATGTFVSAGLCIDAVTCTDINQPFFNSYGHAIATAAASASYGALSVDVYAEGGSSTIGQPGFPSLFISKIQASASAAFDDTIFIGGVSPGSFADFSLSGGGREIDGYYFFGSIGINGQSWTVPIFQPSNTILHIPLASRSGIQVTASLYGVVIDSAPNNLSLGSGVVIGTLSINQIVVRDALGNQLSDFQFSTSSGAEYPFAGGTEAVPEPSTWWLILGGLGMATCGRNGSCRVKGRYSAETPVGPDTGKLLQGGYLARTVRSFRVSFFSRPIRQLAQTRQLQAT